MSNQLVTFNFEGNFIEAHKDSEGNVWFNANHVCAVLKFENSRQAIANHVDSDDVMKQDTIDSLGRPQPTNHINESGLYCLIFGSRKEDAKKFKLWVTREVLPSIHKTGSYSIAQQSPTPIPALADLERLEKRDKRMQQTISDLLGLQGEIKAEIENLRHFITDNTKAKCELRLEQIMLCQQIAFLRENVFKGLWGLLRKEADEETEDKLYDIYDRYSRINPFPYKLYSPEELARATRVYPG